MTTRAGGEGRAFSNAYERLRALSENEKKPPSEEKREGGARKERDKWKRIPQGRLGSLRADRAPGRSL